MSNRQNQDYVWFNRENERVGKHFQRPPACSELMRMTKCWIASNEFFRTGKFLLKAWAEARFAGFIPFKRLDDIKLRAGMMLDGL